MSHLTTHSSQDPEHNVTLEQLRQLASTTSQHKLLNTELTMAESVWEKKFSKRGGPLFQALDSVLNSLHVERQAGHGGTFVGNCAQVRNPSHSTGAL
jgi:hypothetical protein